MEILHRFPIIRTQGWEFKTGEQATTLGAADVIDLNQSGIAEVIERSPQELRDNFRDPLSMVRDHIWENRAGYKDCGFYEFRYAEPVLATPLEHLEKVAQDSGGLVNEKNYPGMHVQVGGVDWQGGRLAPRGHYSAPYYNALPVQSNAVAIHDGFNLLLSPPTSMQALVHKLAPDYPEASWQINPETREFLITNGPG